MSVVFELFTGGHGVVAAQQAKVFGGSGQIVSIPAAPVFVEASSPLHGSASIHAPLPAVFAGNGNTVYIRMPQPGAYGTAFAPPPYAFGDVFVPAATVSGGGHYDMFGDADVALPIAQALGFNGQYAAIQAPLPQVNTVSLPDVAASAAITVFQTPGYVAITTPADDTHKFVFDTIAFSADSPSAQAVLELLDSIAFHGTVTQQVHLHALLAAQIAFGDVAFGAPLGELNDMVQFSDDNVALALYLATLLDSFAVSAELTGSAAVFAFLSDSFEFDASLDVQQQILQALHDGIEFGMTLYTGADTYTAWVMTPETRAMRSYSNYAFNSYAHFGGRLFAAKDDGIYVLEGDTDAGQAISASVRTGLLDFGSRQLKRVERAYLGYTAAGTLALRVTTTSPEGKKIDYTYRMVTPPASDAPRETRVIIGKGLQSVYWAFELDNSMDGKDFELHDVAILPIVLSRKVR